MSSSLVTTEWLASNLNDPNLIILDASTAKNKSGESSKFDNKRIPGSRFFDLKNTFSDPTGKFPNTFPTQTQFEKGASALGINNTSVIVIYDNLGIYTSPRAWWLFKVMGHEKVYVLDGGLPEWIAKGNTTEPIRNDSYEKGNFEAHIKPNHVKDFHFIHSNCDSQEHLVIDARSSGRFNGTSPEPREGLRSGSIPNSLNLPYTEVLHNGKYKPKEELQAIFDKLKIDKRPLTFSCGSGITACIILLAAEQVLNNTTSVYDGSWTEWAQLTN